MTFICIWTCHEWTSKDEVENYNEDIFVEKEELSMKKEMKDKKYWEKHEKKAVHSMKVNYEMPLKWIMLKLNVDEQQMFKGILWHRQWTWSSGNHSCNNPHEKKAGMCEM